MDIISYLYARLVDVTTFFYRCQLFLPVVTKIGVCYSSLTCSLPVYEYIVL